MNFGRQLALTAYYYGSLPVRMREQQSAGQSGQAPVMVLFYHRVADVHPNAWTMPSRAFVSQIRWIRRHFDVVSLAEAQQRIQSNYNDRPAVSITFDDGYAENCDFALPFLAELQLPYTYFVTYDNVVNGTHFLHDLQRRRPLPPNTLDQLRHLPRSLAEIGAHTRTHPDLGQVCDKARLVDEVVGARDDLADALERPVHYFAFPFGLQKNLNSHAFQIAREAGMRGVCSAYGGYNFPGEDSFHMQRIHADPEMIRLKNWLTVDPRKREIPRYSYTLRTQVSSPVGASII